MTIDEIFYNKKFIASINIKEYKCEINDKIPKFITDYIDEVEIFDVPNMGLFVITRDENPIIRWCEEYGYNPDSDPSDAMDFCSDYG